MRFFFQQPIPEAQTDNNQEKIEKEEMK